MSMVLASVRYLGYCRIQSDSERTLAVNNEISSEDPDWHSLFEFLFGRIIVELNGGDMLLGSRHPQTGHSTAISGNAVVARITG